MGFIAAAVTSHAFTTPSAPPEKRISCPENCVYSNAVIHLLWAFSAKTYLSPPHYTLILFEPSGLTIPNTIVLGQRGKLLQTEAVPWISNSVYFASSGSLKISALPLSVVISRWFVEFKIISQAEVIVVPFSTMSNVDLWLKSMPLKMCFCLQWTIWQRPFSKNLQRSPPLCSSWL